MEMITYPLNNVEYTAEDAELYNSTRTSGINNGDPDFNLIIEGGLNITITSGIAWIKNSAFSGKVVASKSPKTIQLPPPSSTFPRYDVIAIQFDSLQNKSSIIVKSGDEISWSPLLPARNVSESVYELFLYSIYRDVNSYEVLEEHIDDLRENPNYCGIMSDSGVPKVPQLEAKSNYISNILQIDEKGNYNVKYMQDGYVDKNSENLYGMIEKDPNFEETAQNFYGYRQVFVTPREGTKKPFIMVKVTELFPFHGREYFNTYNGEVWFGWSSKGSFATIYDGAYQIE